MIIGLIVYLLGCAVVAFVLTVIYVMMRAVNSRDELKSWRVFLISYILTVAAPYGYAEVLTRLVGHPMEAAVQEGVNEADVVGDIAYYKVVYYTGSVSRVVAVTDGKASWGGTDRPIVAISLNKDGNDWKLESYHVVSSFKTNEDGWTFPPYY